ncbi:MAG: family N-acetyltransferase [Nocardioides sp.]|nr:family N-acetyltransferase [Nocardioides sp.]
MDIRPLDLADHDALTAAYLVECSATQRVRPDWVPLGQDARVLGWRAENRWTTQLVGAWELGTLVGFASCMTADDTPDTTWVTVSVAPGSQGRGVGSTLARVAEAAAPASARRFVASAYRPSRDAVDTLLRRFARPLGYALATTETVVELDLRSATLPAPVVADGYAVSTHLNGVPDELREQVGRIKGLVDAEAPSGDLAWGETPVTPAEYVREIELWVAQGRTAVESVAVDEHGSVAAWTCLVAADDPRRPAGVEGTLVVGPHRGRGLGAAVKLACLRRTQQLGTVSRVRTSSDDQNVWMRAINTEIGFAPMETEIIVRKARPAV